VFASVILWGGFIAARDYPLKFSSHHEIRLEDNNDFVALHSIHLTKGEH